MSDTPAPHASPSPSLRRATPLLAALLLPLLVACGGDAEYEISDVRRTAPDPAAKAAATWGYRLPEGWKELPPNTMGGRILGFQIGEDEDATCTFSILPGNGGGLAANVNRWRKQMSLEPASEEEIAALNRRNFLGEQAAEVDLEGTYVGMAGSATIENARLFGLVVVVPQASAFLKMVGPADVVAAARKGFDKLQLSLTPPGVPQGDMPPGHPPTDDLPPGHPPMPGEAAPSGMPPGHPPMTPGAATDGPPSRFQFEKPKGWVQQPPRRMRDVTFKPHPASKAEVYISVLGGMGGGMAANLNRWRQQMGKPALDDEGIAALPTAEVLGGKGTFITITEGDFSGDAGEQVDGAALLGFIVERPDDWVFVKMRGPAAEVLPEQENFVAFCRSLSE